MRWHAEILIHAVLVLWMWRRPDGRPKFSAWLAVRFLFDLAQLLAERFAFGTKGTPFWHLTVATSVWYFGVIAGGPLLLLALHEAEGKWHRRILFSWAAFSWGAAWIRFFPYTGQAVLVCDAAAYVAWLMEKTSGHFTRRQRI